MILMYVVKATGTLRVSKEGELEGIDLHEHGGSAYPELTTGGSHSLIDDSAVIPASSVPNVVAAAARS